MTLKQLNDCYSLSKKIDILQYRQAKIRAAMEYSSPNSSASGAMSCGNTDKMINLFVQLEEITQLLLKSIIALENEQISAQSWLDSLETRCQMIIELRYFQGLRWEEVAVRSGYSIDHVFFINRQVINRLKERTEP